VDAYDPETYRKIRRGGELSKITDACRYLRARKRDYPDLRVEVNNVLFRKIFQDQERFVAFWQGLVDAVNFNAEYYDTFHFRNTFIDPGKRVDCHLQLYLLPTGQMAPCARQVSKHVRHPRQSPRQSLPELSVVDSVEERQGRQLALLQDGRD
jgi:hypothetical protein